ncbi:MAG TPA: hypothetical protein VGE21_11900 [Flavobacteriales bacterium]
MEPTTPPQQDLQALVREATIRLSRPNMNIKDVKTLLLNGGMEPEQVSSLIGSILQQNRERQELKDKAARKDMLIGGIICVVGILITTVSYYNSSGTGSYVVAWGAILVGAVRLFQGASAAS